MLNKAIMLTRRIVLTLSCLLAGSLYAEEEIITFAWENDSFTSYSDSFYTNGARISYLNAERDAPAPARWLADKIPMFKGDPIKGYTLSVGQNMYTPEDISIAGPQPDDRPWAGFSYLSVGMAAGDPAGTVDDVEVMLGVVGPFSYAEDVQIGWHNLKDIQRPNGWTHQLDNEPVIGVAWQRRWPRWWNTPVPTPWGSTHLLSFTPNISGALGNAYTHAAVGGTLRWSTDPAALIDTPVRVRPSMPGTGYFQATVKPNVIYFIGVEERAVARNIFLDGNTFTSSDSVRKRNFVTDVQAGLAVTWKNYQVGYTAVYRTKEFFGQDAGQIFGALSLSYRF
ncbi:MAG: DUF2219 domain-containing protein [Alphaproteobacteria bacterium CG_4_10_14_0_8_um_filter_53_9]|nr:MAG: DUF2219 domain-containing protein [Alphaproteobacteria bacterium CG_4_10_14_0_8_um_filter_53_9]